MKNNKYKILVLSDLKEGTNSTLKNTVSLSKIIGADIEFFYVKKPTDIVETDSQLSAMRVINTEHISIEKQIKKLVVPVSKDYDVKINTSFAFGNVKNEIKDFIEVSKPDIIVLGQRVSNPLQLLGDNITRFVLKEYKGIIMISANNNSLLPNKKMTLGVLNEPKKIFNTEFSVALMAHTKTPLKSFKTLNNQEETANPYTINGKEIVEYVFEQNANTMTTLSKYIFKNNIDLLCIDRVKGTYNSIETPLGEVVRKLNVSLLVSGV